MKVLDKNDRLFFKIIKDLNEKKRHGDSLIVQLTPSKAMHIYYGKHGWERRIYPFYPLGAITIEPYSNIGDSAAFRMDSIWREDRYE
jgi:hypothetical protein